MRATVVRRTAIAASVLSLALLATACGGSDSGGKSGAGKSDGGKGGAKADAAKPAAVALTAAELEKASLTQGDVKGNKVVKAGPEDSVDAGALTVDKQECLPFAHAFFAVKQDTSVPNTMRKVTTEPKGGDGTSMEDLADMPEGAAEEALTSAFDLTSTLVSLSAYNGKDAAGTVTEVREAAAKCAGGFTITMGGEKQKVTKVSAEKVTGGEEALAWTVMTESEGTSVPLKLVVVRQAGTVATFSSFNLAATADGTVDFRCRPRSWTPSRRSSAADLCGASPGHGSGTSLTTVTVSTDPET
ncbi:hypothetical protein NKH18_28645 [Streptomyces sp. M10(2022)]